MSFVFSFLFPFIFTDQTQTVGTPSVCMHRKKWSTFLISLWSLKRDWIAFSQQKLLKKKKEQRNLYLIAAEKKNNPDIDTMAQHAMQFQAATH